MSPPRWPVSRYPGRGSVVRGERNLTTEGRRGGLVSSRFPATGAGDEPPRSHHARQRIMGPLRWHNVPPAGTHGPARRPSRRPSPPVPCGSPPAGLVISSNRGGFQPRAARPGCPESSRNASEKSVAYDIRGDQRPSVLWCITREDKVSSFRLLVAGEAGFHHRLVG